MSFRVACLPNMGFPSFPRPRVQHPQVEAHLQAPRLFILTLLYPGAEPGIFVLLLTLTFH